MDRRYVTDGTIRRLDISRRLYRKDILRVGRWRVGQEDWHVTDDTLREIADNFEAGKSRRLDCPVVWNHSNDVRDRIGKVESVEVDGGTLYAEFEIPECVDESILVNSGGVSVEVREGFTDGLGNEYPIMLTHVGVVNHPVVPNQGEFKRLMSIDANTDKGSSKMRYATRHLTINGKKQAFTRQLAEGDAAAPDEVVTDAPPSQPTDYPALDQPQFDAIKGVIEKLLKRSDSISLPEGMTPENAISMLVNFVTMLEQIKPSITDETPDSEVDATPVDAMKKEDMQLAIQRYRDREKKRAEAEEKQQQLAIATAEQEFRSRVVKLASDGKIPAAATESLLKAGKADGYKLSILDGFDSVKSTIKTKTLSNANVTPDADGKETYAEAIARGKRLVGVYETKK